MAENVGIARAKKKIASVSSSTTSAILLLLVVVSMTITDGLRTVYAQAIISAECNGNTIERGNFDGDPEDEVKVDGTVYNNGEEITLDGKTYTVRIATPSTYYTPYNGTSGNDFIVGTSSNDYIYGKGGDDFIIGFGGNDWLYGDRIDGTSDNDTLKGGDDILCGNNGNDILYGDYIHGGSGNDTMTGGNDKLDGGDGDYDELYGDFIHGEEGGDNITGGNDKLDGGDGGDFILGDFIVGGDGDNTLTGGNDTLYGGEGNDSTYGDFIVGGDGDNITGGNDTLDGGSGNDILSGDFIVGGDGDNTMTGGNDTLYGGEGYDGLYGDWIDGHYGNDTAYGGNDVIDVRDDVVNNDSIDGDLISAESTTLGDQDICASDPGDLEDNCEYDDISTLATLEVSSSTIQVGQPVDITFNSSVDNPVKITSLTVTTPNGSICTYNALPIIVSENGTFTATYPDDFSGTDCDTSAIGEYTVVAKTEVGDPIITNFTVPFQVVPEAIAGIASIVGAGFLSMLLYRRLRVSKKSDRVTDSSSE
ncbi:MAG: calcium-binding protein [Nitrososphaera sp.]|jgi:Ca2+-binding RTX toxin-like protein|uniref:calcium-binding protein n=1 Tax=Candidatus Nitrosocaldus islandicus TaxID=2045011 RepID=UPI000CD03BBB|nr:calcium-binding protein [Candidatus Nitrosocaldus islandicus]